MLRSSLLVAATVLVPASAVGGCTQDVVVVSGAGGGVGSAVSGMFVGTSTIATSAIAQTSVGVGGAGDACETPAPVGALEPCGGSAAAVSSAGAGGFGGSQMLLCSESVCDLDSNNWTALCDAQGCTCQFNGNVICACIFSGAEGCDGVPGNGCCPAPWPDP